MSLQKIALIGATGDLGSHILDALVDAGSFEVTVLQRKSSQSKPKHSSKIRIVSVADDYPFDGMKQCLQGQDAVIVAFRLKDLEQHYRIADAAVAAGVKRFIPADFGSCDSSSQRAQELIPLFKKKSGMGDRLQELARSHSNFTWTSIVCGHFFDWGLKEDFLHFNLASCTADILDDGNMKSSQSTLERVAQVTARILQRPKETSNRVLFVQSFCVSQNEVLASLEKATTSKWTVNRIDSEKFIREHKQKAEAGDAQANEELVFALGAVDGNWETRDEFAMSLLGLENENLDDVVKRVVASVH